MESIAIIILAAGLGKRLGRSYPKVLEKTEDGIPLIKRVLESALVLKPEKLVVVTGHGSDAVKEELSSYSETTPSIEYAFQKEQLGTGDAVRAALPLLKTFSGTVLVLYGDVPLLKTETINRFLTCHQKEKATVSVMTFECREENSYGRIVKTSDGRFIAEIIEAKDASFNELQISEVNSGIMAVDSAFLAPAVEALENKNAQKEYYLTDIVKRATDEGQTVIPFKVDAGEVLGVNDLWDLDLINRKIRSERIKKLIKAGVVIKELDSCFVDASSRIAAGVEIGPAVQILGDTTIESGVVIEGTAYIKDSKISSGARIKLGCRIEGAQIGENAQVGPFAHIRPGSSLGKNVKVGNFVETKKAELKEGAKASHLTYLGDCSVGKDANIGAGTITCNYDGYKKYRTEIGDGAFIGSNTALIAPVKIGAGATVGAGSAIAKDVSPDALALTRAEQKEIAGWTEKKRKKMEES
ncbi:MAG: UDP-N-acetylglucosamine diphosphorylase/glucosamine-1-phosphate N-acetyltransferase [Candidatus Dadabacteria bacterium]|nr:MAG: UDP-N-acetylglucosamine diphosphorylase/glucosamine-1-phosphate N-acetyltransferase [Candidatus Dadabacteria bacterium]